MDRRGRGRGASLVVEAARRGLRGPDGTGNYHACCPRCVEVVGRDDEEWKLNIRWTGRARVRPHRDADPEDVALSPRNAVWSCYRCKFRGVGDLSEIAGPSGPTEAAGGEATAPARGVSEELRQLREDMAAVAENSLPVNGGAVEARAHRDYLRRRGVLEQAVAAGALACVAGKYRDRVVLPVRAGPGMPWQGFSARAIGDSKVRYLYPRKMDRRSAIWGMHAPAAEGPLWLVEGVFDGLPLWPLARATLGKAVTDEQVDVLVRIGRPIVVCLDGDAWEEGRALSMQLRLRGVPSAWCRLPPGADPGKLGWRVREHVQGPMVT